MNQTSWKRILDKYAESIGPRRRIIVLFKTAHEQVAGIIKEIDEDFLVIGTEDGRGIEGIVVLEDVVGIRTP
jgi:hypothetical protein